MPRDWLVLVPREARIRRTFVYNLPGVCFKQVMIDSFLLSGSLETENKGGLSSLGTWLCNSQHIGFPLLPSAWIASILHTYQNTFRRSGFPFLRSTTSTYSYIAVSFISRRSSLASILLVVV